MEQATTEYGKATRYVVEVMNYGSWVRWDTYEPTAEGLASAHALADNLHERYNARTRVAADLGAGQVVYL
jgi:hypothetical protein